MIYHVLYFSIGIFLPIDKESRTLCIWRMYNHRMFFCNLFYSWIFQMLTLPPNACASSVHRKIKWNDVQTLCTKGRRCSCACAKETCAIRQLSTIPRWSSLQSPLLSPSVEHVRTIEMNQQLLPFCFIDIYSYQSDILEWIRSSVRKNNALCLVYEEFEGWILRHDNKLLCGNIKVKIVGIFLCHVVVQQQNGCSEWTSFCWIHNKVSQIGLDEYNYLRDMIYI